MPNRTYGGSEDVPGAGEYLEFTDRELPLIVLESLE
jgi:hypothetical protein